jgi:hypothetical protein
VGGWFVKTDTNGFALPNGADTLYHIGFIENGISQSYKMKVYPNPVSDFLTIEFDKLITGKISITVFDMTGRIVLNKEKQNQQMIKLNISKLTKGIYLLKINLKNDNGIAVKIIKN